MDLQRSQRHRRLDSKERHGISLGHCTTNSTHRLLTSPQGTCPVQASGPSQRPKERIRDFFWYFLNTDLLSVTIVAPHVPDSQQQTQTWDNLPDASTPILDHSQRVDDSPDTRGSGTGPLVSAQSSGPTLGVPKEVFPEVPSLLT